jgi:outer membrane immunogenic protein
MSCTCLKLLKLPLTAAFAIAAFSAQAADIYTPRMSAVPVYEVPQTWTGFYAGINSGYGWGATSNRLDNTADTNNPGILLSPTYLAGFGTSKLSAEGGFGGGQLGYNLQRDHFVFGIETDLQGAGIKGNTFSEALASTLAAGPTIISQVDTEAWARSNLDWFGTLRGRAGYTFGTTLLYATGGLAYGGVRDSLRQSVLSASTPSITPLNPAFDAVNRNTTLTGWVAGAGVELALSPSWSAKAEYQYINLGSTTLAAVSTVPYVIETTAYTDTGRSAVKFDHTYNTVRLGLNYRFNQVYEPLK